MSSTGAGRAIAHAPIGTECRSGHLLDLYRPEQPNDESQTIRVLLGVGGWGARECHPAESARHFFDADHLARGVSTQSSTQAYSPPPVHDISAAIGGLSTQSAGCRVDPNRSHVMGGSLGVVAGQSLRLEAPMRVTLLPRLQRQMQAGRPIDASALRSCRRGDNAEGLCRAR